MAHGARLDPLKEFRAYRRNLPHIELAGSVYFITFRTLDGVKLADAAKDIVLQTVEFHAGKKYDLHACVVMETHVHLVITPLRTRAPASRPHLNEAPYYSLGQIMHSIKSYSAKRIQKVLLREGSLWLDENYDRVIRDDKEYLETLNYIVYNPAKAGLVARPEDYKWLSCTGLR